MAQLGTFDWPDYLVMFTVILISLGIGLYHAFTGDKQKKSSEYFLGNRELWMVPVAMSVVATAVSSNTVLGIPSEVYGYGSTYVWIAVSGLFSFVFSALFVLPLLYPLGLTSIYEYFELRYGGVCGKLLRLYTMFLQILTQLCQVATIVYGPALALEIATGIPVPWLLVTIPLVGILYTSLGGIKGVVYADAFQCVVMFFGMLLAIAVGTMKLDKASDVWDLAWKWDRIQPQTKIDPTARSTVFSIMVGGFFTGLAGFGTNQAVIQRALGTKTLRRAQYSYVISGPLSLVTQVIAVALGLVVFAYYANIGCDPIVNKDIGRPDQILPLYLVSVIDYPTVAGFFYAAVICASLSTISSSINSATAIIWDDVLGACCKRLTEFKQSVIRKVIAVVYGCLLIGGAFVLEFNKRNATLIGVAFSVYGALQGPVLGMFLLAAFVPFSNGPGALTGGILAACLTTWMMVGRIQLGVFFQRLPVPTDGCLVPISDSDQQYDGNSTIDTTTVSSANNMTVSFNDTMEYLKNYTTTASESMMGSTTDNLTDLEWFFSISFWYYAVIAVVIVLAVGTLVSLATWTCTTRTTKKRYLFRIIRECAGEEDEEKTKI